MSVFFLICCNYGGVSDKCGIIFFKLQKRFKHMVGLLLILIS